MCGRRNQKNQETGQGESAKNRVRRVPNLDLGKNALQGEFPSAAAAYSARKSHLRQEDSRIGTYTGRGRTLFEKQVSQTRDVVSPEQARDGPSLGKKGTLYSQTHKKEVPSPFTLMPASGERPI